MLRVDTTLRQIITEDYVLTKSRLQITKITIGLQAKQITASLWTLEYDNAYVTASAGRDC